MADAVLAVDLGGSVTRVALVQGATVLDRAERPTDRAAGPGQWVQDMVALAQPMQGRFSQIGVTVTGLVQGGRWQAMNSGILDVPPGFDLRHAVQAAFGLAPVLANDAQAAAYGEWLYGAGLRKDMVFLTISTGVGGGVVAGGRLLTGRSGMAGHFGQMLSLPDADRQGRFEDNASGLWIAATAGVADARTAFATPQAGAVIDRSAARVARLAQNLQLAFDPQHIVIGGGVGLAPGYLSRIAAHLAHLPDLTRPTLVPAALGADAGLIGIAALTLQQTTNTEDET